MYSIQRRHKNASQTEIPSAMINQHSNLNGAASKSIPRIPNQSSPVLPNSRFAVYLYEGWNRIAVFSIFK